MAEFRARVITHRPGLYELWCDEHSVSAMPRSQYAPQAVLTNSLEYAQKRVDSHNEKWHNKLEDK